MVDFLLNGAGCQEPIDRHLLGLPNPPGSLTGLHTHRHTDTHTLQKRGIKQHNMANNCDDKHKNKDYTTGCLSKKIESDLLCCVVLQTASWDWCNHYIILSPKHPCTDGEEVEWPPLSALLNKHTRPTLWCGRTMSLRITTYVSLCACVLLHIFWCLISIFVSLCECI